VASLGREGKVLTSKHWRIEIIFQHVAVDVTTVRNVHRTTTLACLKAKARALKSPLVSRAWSKRVLVVSLGVDHKDSLTNHGTN
jgi:hypothetical protein